MPNVKAGDLAIVKSTKPQYNGRIVEVIDRAPVGGFYLPNGRWHRAPKPAALYWIIKSLSGPMQAPTDDGQWELVQYGVGADAYLFPLPGETDETSIEERSPVTVGAPRDA